MTGIRAAAARAAAFAVSGLAAALLCSCAPSAEFLLLPPEPGHPDARPGRSLAASRPVPQITERSGLDDYLKYAEYNNPGLSAAHYRWLASLDRVPQARALPDPMLGFMAEFNDGIQLGSVMLSQTFPWFGKRGLAAEAAWLAAQAELHRYLGEKLALAFRVKDAYYDYYYLARSVAITEENIALLANLEKVVRSRYEAGTAPLADLLRIQVEQGKLDNDLRTMRAMRAPIVAKLNAALNRPSIELLPWPAAAPEEPPPFTEEQLLGWAAESNPELQALDDETAAQEKKIKLARKMYYPDPTFGIGGINRSKRMMMGMDTVTASLGFNIPLWRGKLDAALREVVYERAAAERRRADRANSLAADVQMAAWRFHDADRRIRLYRDSLIPKAREALQITQKDFEGGKALFADFIDTQRTLLEFQLARDRAVADRAQRLAELETLLGRSLTHLGPAGEPPPHAPAPKREPEPGGVPETNRELSK